MKTILIIIIAVLAIINIIAIRNLVKFKREFYELDTKYKFWIESHYNSTELLFKWMHLIDPRDFDDIYQEIKEKEALKKKNTK